MYIPIPIATRMKSTAGTAIIAPMPLAAVSCFSVEDGQQCDITQNVRPGTIAGDMEVNLRKVIADKYTRLVEDIYCA